MKKLLLLLALLFTPLSASAQVGNMFVLPFAGVPSGTCAEPLAYAINTTNGDFYSCNSGAWVKIGPGGAATGYQTIEEEGTPLTQRTTLNMIGGTVTCVDNVTKTDCTFTAGGGTHDILSATHTDSTPAAVLRGGQIVGVGATPKWTLVTVGGANTIWSSDGTDPSWEVATGTASPVRANNPLFPVQVRFTAIAAPAYSAGQFFYDSDNEALGFHNNEADITLQVGQEGWVRVRNESGATITDGQVVYIDGIVSGLPSIALAKADALSTALAVGFATHDIENLSNGFVTLYGVVRDVNTTGLTDDVYLSATTAGGMVDSPPSDPNFVVLLGTIVETGATGDVFVNIIAPGPTGGAGIAVSGNSVAVDLLTADDQVGSSSNQSGLEFGGVGSDKLGLLRGCLNGQVEKFNTTGGLWECANDNDSGGSPTLDSIIAAAGAATINNGDNAIVWNFSLTTADKVAFKFGENTASVATGNPIILNAVTLAASTAHPFQATSRGTADGVRVGATDGVMVALGTGGLDWPALLNYPTGCTNQFIRAILDTPTCNTVGMSDIAANAVDNTIIRDSVGFSVIGKTATGTGDPADIVAADETVLGRTAAGNLLFAQVATGQIANSAVNSLKLATANKTLKCNFVLFRDTGLKDSDDINSISNCTRPGRAITITVFRCETDAGSPIVNAQRDDGTPANLLTGDLTCTTGGADGTIAAAEDNFAATDALDFVAVSGMSGANRISLMVEFTVD